MDSSVVDSYLMWSYLVRQVLIQLVWLMQFPLKSRKIKRNSFNCNSIICFFKPFKHNVRSSMKVVFYTWLYYSLRVPVQVEALRFLFESFLIKFLSTLYALSIRVSVSITNCQVRLWVGFLAPVDNSICKTIQNIELTAFPGFPATDFFANVRLVKKILYKIGHPSYFCCLRRYFWWYEDHLYWTSSATQCIPTGRWLRLQIPNLATYCCI